MKHAAITSASPYFMRPSAINRPARVAARSAAAMISHGGGWGIARSRILGPSAMPLTERSPPALQSRATDAAAAGPARLGDHGVIHRPRALHPRRRGEAAFVVEPARAGQPAPLVGIVEQRAERVGERLHARRSRYQHAGLAVGDDLGDAVDGG